MSQTIETKLNRKENFEDEVREDVTVGLLALLTPVDGLACEIDRDRTVIINDMAFVYWTYTGRHTEPFRSLSPFMDKDHKPDAADIVVEGLTIVRRNVDSGEFTFERHIDWNAVVAQLGASRGRTHIPPAGNRPPAA
jgi:hypothetical protein